MPYNRNWYCGARFWIFPTLRDEEENEDDNSGVLLFESCEIVLAEAAPNTINQMITTERATTVSIRTIYRCETFFYSSALFGIVVQHKTHSTARQTDTQCKVCIHVVVLFPSYFLFWLQQQRLHQLCLLPNIFCSSSCLDITREHLPLCSQISTSRGEKQRRRRRQTRSGREWIKLQSWMNSCNEIDWRFLQLWHTLEGNWNRDRERHLSRDWGINMKIPKYQARTLYLLKLQRHGQC